MLFPALRGLCHREGEGERGGVLSVVLEMKLNLSVSNLMGSPERYPQKT